jgi:hypothetical protein
MKEILQQLLNKMPSCELAVDLARDIDVSVKRSDIPNSGSE